MTDPLLRDQQIRLLAVSLVSAYLDTEGQDPAIVTGGPPRPEELQMLMFATAKIAAAAIRAKVGASPVAQRAVLDQLAAVVREGMGL